MDKEVLQVDDKPPPSEASTQSNSNSHSAPVPATGTNHEPGVVGGGFFAIRRALGRSRIALCPGCLHTLLFLGY